MEMTPLPAYRFRDELPSLWTMLREGVGDAAAMVPASILAASAIKLTGPGAPLVVSDPDLIRQVLTAPDDTFTRDRIIRRLFRRSWGKGLAGAEGEAWQAQRRAAVPAFRPQAVAAYLTSFAGAARTVSNQTESGTVLLTELTARIVARIVLSVLVAAEDHCDPDEAAADMPAYVRKIAGFSLIDLLPLPERWIDRWHGVDRDPAVLRLRALGSALAHSRDVNSTDLISLLEGVGPVVDNIRGLFPAAMDTTVAGTSWVLYLLSREAGWQDRAAAEAQACEGNYTLDRLPIMRQVVSEALRLYPPAPLLARSAARDMRLGEFPLRKGQTVIAHIYAMHRHRQHWHDPDRFDPERFAPGAAVPAAYLPFGSGPRMCIAAQFAKAEIAVIVAALLTEFRLTATREQPLVRLQATTRSDNGLWAKIEPR